MEEQELVNETATPACERIVVEVVDRKTGRMSRRAFKGRFIIGNDVEGEEFLHDEEVTGKRGGGDYAVAVTQAGGL